MIKIIIDKKLKYTILFLILLLLIDLGTYAIDMTHQISQISKKQPDRTKLDDDNNGILDLSDETYFISTRHITNYPEKCPAGKLPVGFDEKGKFICRTIGVRCGEPNSDDEQLCLIEDK